MKYWVGLSVIAISAGVLTYNLDFIAEKIGYTASAKDAVSITGRPRIVDGDTLKYPKLRIRFAKIDTCERPKPCLYIQLPSSSRKLSFGESFMQKICKTSLWLMLTCSLAVGDAKADPVTTSIAVGSLIVSGIGSIFGGKSARAAARARQKQYEAMMVEIKAVGEEVKANRKLISAVFEKIGNLTEDGERLRLHTESTSGALSLYKNIVSLEDAAFVLQNFELGQVSQSLSASIEALETANDFYKGRLMSGNDFTLLPLYTANIEALITAFHLQSLLSAKDADTRRILDACLSSARMEHLD